MSEHHLPTITIEDNGTVSITDLQCGDSALRELLRGEDPGSWPQLVCRALGVGARGLLSMGLGVSIAELDDRFRTSLEEVADRSEARVASDLDAAHRVLTEHLDPELRTSLVGRTLDRLRLVGDDLIRRLDPDLAGSDSARLIAEMRRLVGKDGDLEATLRSALDLQADGSALAAFAAVVEDRFRELRDLVAREDGRVAEAERGTAKGVDFEDTVEVRLRQLAGGMSGCLVERTSRLPGALGPSSLVGDFVVEFPTGRRVVVEAKNTATLSLHGKGGILDELDRARQNRQADFAVCVSAQDAFPTEVGAFGVYGERVLVVDDGDDALLAVALRWCQAMMAADVTRGRDLDTGLVLERLERIRSLAQRLSGTKRTLYEVRTSVDSVRDQIGEMRSDLLDMVEDVRRHVAGAAPGEATAPLHVA